MNEGTQVGGSTVIIPGMGMGFGIVLRPGEKPPTAEEVQAAFQTAQAMSQGVMAAMNPVVDVPEAVREDADVLTTDTAESQRRVREAIDIVVGVKELCTFAVYRSTPEQIGDRLLSVREQLSRALDLLGG